MIAVFRKELTAFFSSLTGYIAIAVFLVLMSLILWVFPNNALDNGYATLDILFNNAPLVFMLFSEEKRAGTLELLATRPVTELQIVLGKFFAAWFLVIFAVLPTLLYFYTIQILGSPPGNIDSGASWGSYIGLILISASFISIGLFASSLTENQNVAFLLAAFLSFVALLAFDAISGLGFLGGKADIIIQSIGMQYHYDSISRGVVDSRDVIYFISMVVIFILCTKTALESRKW